MVVIGVGNALRHDDAAGLEVARRLRTRATAATVTGGAEAAAGGGDAAGGGAEAAGGGAEAAAHREIAVLEHEGEPLGLLECWHGARAVVLVDAVRSGAAPGSIHRVELSCEPFAEPLRGSSSTHAVGLGEAIELARALDLLPQRVLFYGVEGVRFDAGSGLSPAVAEVIAPLAQMVLSSATELADVRAWSRYAGTPDR